MDIDNSSEIFFKSIVSERVRLKPNELHREYKDVILRKLRDSIEGRCTRNGYVKKNSIRLYKVSTGAIETNSLNGDTSFTVTYKCDICNPAKGAIIPSRVVNTNKFGILSQSGTVFYGEDGRARFIPVIEIVVPKQVYKSDVDLDKVAIGDTLRVEVLGKKFKLNGFKIQVTARGVSLSHENDVLSAAPRKNASEYISVVEDAEEVNIDANNGVIDDHENPDLNELSKDTGDDDNQSDEDYDEQHGGKTTKVKRKNGDENESDSEEGEGEEDEGENDGDEDEGDGEVDGVSDGDEYVDGEESVHESGKRHNKEIIKSARVGKNKTGGVVMSDDESEGGAADLESAMESDSVGGGGDDNMSSDGDIF
jgi:DNA-directed RNA polymerase subunit E'/Rpb7